MLKIGVETPLVWNDEGMAFLGMVLGVVCSLALVFGSMVIRPAIARRLAPFGVAFAVLILLVAGLLMVDRDSSFEIAGDVLRGLIVAFLSGVLLALPRLLRWREPFWVALGLGWLVVLTLILLSTALNYGLHDGLKVDPQAEAAGQFLKMATYALLPAALLGAGLGWQKKTSGSETR